MMARVGPLALTALLFLAGLSPAQYPGAPRRYDPFTPHLPGPFDPRPAVPRPGHFPGDQGPGSARPTPGFRGDQLPPRKDQDDKAQTLRTATKAGQYAGHLFTARHTSPRFEPRKVSVPALTPPRVTSSGSWLSRAGSSVRAWLAGVAAAIAAALGAVFRPR